MTRSAAVFCLLLAGGFAVGGCAPAPPYVRPNAPVPAAWPASPPDEGVGADASAADGVSWGECFADEKLRALVGLALENNRDLRVAALLVERSRAQYQIQRADLVPKVGATGAAPSQRISEELSSTGEGTIARQYTLGVGLTAYELDFFGRVRSLKDRALEQYLATEQARGAAQLALVAEVAARYLALGADLDHLGLAAQTLAAQEASVQLVKKRFELGVISELDLRQAQTSLEVARGDVARYTAQGAQDRNALDLLAGAAVSPDLLPVSLAPVAMVKGVAPGLPADVLLRRPDVLQAENQLRAAHANIGAARAAFFPRITLTTSVGLGSDELSGLFGGGARLWSFLPQITVPIFQGGANRANLEAAEVDRDVALAQYEKAIQGAFREVADALAQEATLGDQLAAQEALVEAASATHRLSEARYRGGIDSYLTVLDSQRALYAARHGLITVRLARLTNRVTFDKVLGRPPVRRTP